jgi:hypothetical protein
MGFSFRSPGFSRFCHRLLRDPCDYRPWLILPLRSVSRPQPVTRLCSTAGIFSPLLLVEKYQMIHYHRSSNGQSSRSHHDSSNEIVHFHI